MPADPPTPDIEETPGEVPTDYEDLETSEHGLDWGDISQIRRNLRMTPVQRLRAAQDLLNTVLRIRAGNAPDRG